MHCDIFLSNSYLSSLKTQVLLKLPDNKILAGVFSLILIFEVKKSIILFPTSRHMQYVCVVLDFQFELGGIVIQISHLERERDDQVNNISIIFL